MTAPSPSNELIARYLSNEAGADERAAVDAWAAASPENRDELARLREAWASRTSSPGGGWDVDRAWTKVASRMDAPGDSETASIDFRRDRARWRTSMIVRIAAVLVLVVGGSLYIRSLVPTAVPAPAIAFATNTGERREVELTDGTRITIAPASEVRIHEGYGLRDRQVELTGEAWFEVVHDARRPFEVHAAGTVTRDIGTAFAIRALPGDSVVRVAVLEGIASLRREGQAATAGVTLNARDVGIARGSAPMRVERDVATDAVASWRDGRLEFDSTPMRDVSTELARWFGVVVQFEAGEVAGRTVNATIRTTDLTEALDILSRSLGVRIERRGDTVFVR